VKSGGRYIDCTVGAGGHASGILSRSAPKGLLLGIDLDPEALKVAQGTLAPFGERALLVEADFRDLKRVAREHLFHPVDGILLDLGLSFLQLDRPERGFSFLRDGPLDMRFSPRQKLTAGDLVNRLPQEELVTLLKRYGQEQKAKSIARAITLHRPLESTRELAGIVAQVVGRRRKLHPATKAFLALRIAVNDELTALEEALPQAVEILAPGGRLAVISFHSLEDRIVKEFMRRESRDCLCPPEVPVCRCGHRRSLQVITKKPIRPTPGEVERNPHSRSARLRIAARLQSVD